MSTSSQDILDDTKVIEIQCKVDINRSCKCVLKYIHDLAITFGYCIRPLLESNQITYFDTKKQTVT